MVWFPDKRNKARSFLKDKPKWYSGMKIIILSRTRTINDCECCHRFWATCTSWRFRYPYLRKWHWIYHRKDCCHFEPGRVNSLGLSDDLWHGITMSCLVQWLVVCSAWSNSNFMQFRLIMKWTLKNKHQCKFFNMWKYRLQNVGHFVQASMHHG